MPGKPNPDRNRIRLDWKEAFGSPPPAFLSVAFMRNALEYEAQCKARGGLPPATRRALASVLEGRPARRVAMQVARPGAHLVRDWNGRTYQVEVIEGGYRLDGKTWSSLSAIARHITGTTWSGPRFFGLTRRARATP